MTVRGDLEFEEWTRKQDVENVLRFLCCNTAGNVSNVSLLAVNSA